MRRVTLNLSGHQITGDDAGGLAVNGHNLKHLGVGDQFDVTALYLTRQGLVGTKQQLLTGLPPRVEGA